MRVIPCKTALPFLLLALATLSAQAQVARVIEVRGASVVERTGEPPRILGAGERLERRDLVRTARDSHAIIEFDDQRRVTLRPNTVFRIDAYDGRTPEGVALGLVRGGLRAESGRSDKGNPGLAQVQAGSTRIEARSGDFDVRLCEDDCKREQGQRPATVSSPDVIARVVEMKGTASVARPGERARRLVPGAAIREKESIVTGSGSHAVLAFRDGSRISLAENSQLAILTFRFDERERSGNAEIHHLAGGARVMTGAIGKQSPEHYRFMTPLGELRPHGTGWDSVASKAGAVVDQGVDTVKQGTETLVNAVSDTAAEVARVALDRATSPALREMTKMVSALRNTPPATEAEWNQVISQVTRLSGELQGALTTAVNAAGAAADVPAFKAAVGLTLATQFETLAVMSLGRSGFGDEGLPAWTALQAQVAISRNDRYQSDSLALVGLSDVDLARVRDDRMLAHAVIETEIGTYVASQGSAAARDFFAEAKAAAGVLQEHARQAAEAAKLASEQAAKLAAEEAARKAEEMKRQVAAKLTEGKVQAEQVGQTARDTAKEAGAAVASGVQNVAAETAQRALETATAPIMREMTRLMSILRNNPPATEAEWNQLVQQVTQVSGSLRSALASAVSAAGAAANSPAFKSMVGLAWATNLESMAALAAIPPQFNSDPGLAGWTNLLVTLPAVRSDPYVSESLALVGLSDADLQQVGESRYMASPIIVGEVGSFLASQGNAAARDFFAEAQAAAAAAQQRAQQAGVAAVSGAQNVAGEAAQLVLETATSPILQEMTRLMSILRNNPPATEAEWNRLVQQVTQLSGSLHSALTSAVNAAGAAAESSAFKSAVGLALAAEFEALAVLGSGRSGFGDEGLPSWTGLRQLVANARNDRYQSESLALVGLSDADLARVEGSRYEASGIIAVEVGSYLASQGNAAARDFFVEAQAVGEAARQAAQKSEPALRTAYKEVLREVAEVIERQTEVTQAITGVRGNEAGAPPSESSSPYPPQASVIVVWDGSVEAAGRIAGKGDLLRLNAKGQLSVDKTSSAFQIGAPRPDLVKVDPDLFSGSVGGLAAGLYVWARDGAVVLVADGKAVEVPAGSAAVVANGALQVLDAVPSFLRFDQAPVAGGSSGGVPAVFVAPDGSFGSCRAI